MWHVNGGGTCISYGDARCACEDSDGSANDMNDSNDEDVKNDGHVRSGNNDGRGHDVSDSFSFT